MPLVLVLYLSAIAGCEGDVETLKGPVGVFNGKAPTHGFLGVEFATDPKRALEVSRNWRDVEAGTSGLEVGDKILTMNGRPMKTFAELQDEIGKTHPGEVARVEVLRNDQHRTLETALLSFEQIAGMKNRALGTGRNP